MVTKGIKITKIEKNSAAEEIGLVPGDRILKVNGHDIADELALKFYLADETVDLYVRRSSGLEQRLEAHRADAEDLGIEVEEFKTRTCNNACVFCFVDQLPPHVRPTLKVKDDDYRLSFLHGNYITLTNLTDKDLDRITEQRLSPLYVSVHATDPDLRTWILGRKKVDDLSGKIKKLVGKGIVLHAQIVLMPEINDGRHLENTVFGLHAFYPGLRSVAVVPLGLSDHGKQKNSLKPVTPAYSRRLIRLAESWQSRFRAQIGRTFVYLADEFYIQAGVDIPGDDYYDDFAQIEDGVGMVRTFLNDFETEIKRRRKIRLPLKGTLVTGRLFSPILQRCMDRFNDRFGAQLRICKTENLFLGKSITVAGLLGGGDILAALKNRDPGDFVVIPNEAVSRVDGILIDNLSPGDLSRRLERPVYTSGQTVRDFFRLLFSAASS
jgi:putative radical SAM enzyme (TIGR03279 family)